MAPGNPVVPEFDDGETASAGRVVGMGDGLQCSPRSQKQQRMEEVPFWSCSARTCLFNERVILLLFRLGGALINKRRFGD